MDYSALLEQDRDALIVELARSQRFEASPSDALVRGKELYATLRASLKQKICTDPAVKRIATGGRTPETVAALADLISTMTHGVPAATLSVLLVKDGLDSLCGHEWS